MATPPFSEVLVTEARQSIRVGLLGCGTVGGGVIRLIERNRESITARVGAPVEVAHVLVRDASRERVSECKPEWVTTAPEVVFGDDSVDVYVEVMGGEEPAKSYVERAMSLGRGVVSANKYLLALHGPALLQQAADNTVDLALEASVGGGIPVIRTLREALTSDSVDSVHAILNGTCNYILTRMRNEGIAFEPILKDAQNLGYAEAEPSLDVDGHDAAQKLVVLSMLAFGASVNVEDVHVEGIRDVDDIDFAFAERFGLTIKHLAIGHERGDKIELRVHPALISKESVLGNVNDVLNGAFLQGRALGPCLIVGRGAGEMPTAVSVVSDLVDVARGKISGRPGLATKVIRPVPRALVPMSEVETKYYLRFEVADESGVLGMITGALGDEGVSISQVMQEGRGANGESVPVLIITHPAAQGAIDRALAKISQSGSMKKAPRLIRIEDL